MIMHAQTVDTLISEKAFLLAKFLRDERKRWVPRIGLTESEKTNKDVNGCQS